jgi:hypothetical protein
MNQSDLTRWTLQRIYLLMLHLLRDRSELCETSQFESKTPCSLDDLPSFLEPQFERVATVDNQQVFQLIDRILPFEACLYHQVLPLSLKDQSLQLGMVTLEDVAALNYVRQILTFMDYSLVPQTITSDAHYATLSAYLNHINQAPVVPSEEAVVDLESEVTSDKSDRSQENHVVIEQNSLEIPESFEQSEEAEDQSTIVIQDANATFLVDSPDEIDDSEFSTKIQLARSDQAPQDDHRPSPSQEPPAVPATFLLDSEPLSPSKLPIPGSALPTLEISTDYLNSNPEHLSSLPPAQLLRELLGRIFTGGIGRLYFERCEAMGRILWSQNGVLQSVLSDLPLSSFQGVINELKQLTHLPMTPVQKPKQVEIERLCQQTRLLVRLRVMPNAHGEEATLQILHGAALKFYQQQQVANLSRDALNIAKDLQQKVREIHDRTQADAQLPDQANLTQVLQIIEQQIAALKQLE